MRKQMGLLCLLCLLAPACAPSVNIEQQKSALLDADRAWAQTTTNLDNMMSYFTSDASVFPPNMPITSGHDAIRQMLGEMMEMPGFELSWEPMMADVGAAGDLGYTYGTYEMTFEDAAGVPMTEKGKYVTVWKKQDGAWKVVADSFNTDEPPPAAPAPTKK